MTYKHPNFLEEFDLSKYAALEDFGPEKWAILIKSRLFLQSLLGLSEKAFAGTTPDGLQKAALRKFIEEPEDLPSRELAENPCRITDLRENTSIEILNRNMFDVQIERFFDNPLSLLNGAALDTLSSTGLSIPSVKPLSAAAILALQRAVLEVNEKLHDQLSIRERAPYAVRWDGDHLDRPIDELLELSDHYRVRHMANLAVDLNRSDQDIRSDFNTLLSEYRKVFDLKPPPITPVTLKRWCDNLVLPYIDLMLWSKWSKTPLKAKDYESLLVSSKGVNNALKGTKNAFKEAFSPAAVDALLRSHEKTIKK